MKKLSHFILLSTLSFIPILNVEAATSTVHNQSELKTALADENITVIELANDIETTEKINITRPVTIDGNGYTMKYVGTFNTSGSTDNTIWKGIYLLQVYKTEATIRNIKLTNGNAALLLNGSKVKLEGNIDVSGNGFGGIELGQGKDVTTVSHLVISDGAKIINITESSTNPTLWVPSDTPKAILEMNGLVQTINAGEELTLAEITNLFTPQVNPDTGDTLVISIILGISGLIIFVITSKKLLTQK